LGKERRDLSAGSVYTAKCVAPNKGGESICSCRNISRADKGQYTVTFAPIHYSLTLLQRKNETSDKKKIGTFSASQAIKYRT